MLQNVASNLRDFVIEELLYAFDSPELGLDDELLGSGLLDSMASAQLMMHVESEFEIKLKPTDLTFENFNTLNALAQLVNKRR